MNQLINKSEKQSKSAAAPVAAAKRFRAVAGFNFGDDNERVEKDEELTGDRLPDAIFEALIRDGILIEITESQNTEKR